MTTLEINYITTLVYIEWNLFDGQDQSIMSCGISFLTKLISLDKYLQKHDSLWFTNKINLVRHRLAYKKNLIKKKYFIIQIV